MHNLTPSLPSLELLVFVSIGVLRSAIRNPQPPALATQAGPKVLVVEERPLSTSFRTRPMNGCGGASTKVMVVFLLFLFPPKSSVANHLFTFVYLSQMKILPLQPAGTAESAGLGSGEALQTQASTEDAGKEQQKLPMGVLNNPVEFPLTERS